MKKTSLRPSPGSFFFNPQTLFGYPKNQNLAPVLRNTYNERGKPKLIEPLRYYKLVVGEKVTDFIHYRDSLPNKYKPFITPLDYKGYEAKNADLYLSEDYQSGYSITMDGTMLSLFSLPGAKQGHRAIQDAIMNGAKKLDCFDTGLAGIYKRHGFQEYDRRKWSEDFAPTNWFYQIFGRPDIVYMCL